MLSEDVVSREVVGSKLFTKRLLCKSGRLPRWGERYFQGLKYVYIIEESIVDLSTNTLTSYTRNIGKQHWMVSKHGKKMSHVMRKLAFCNQR